MLTNRLPHQLTKSVVLRVFDTFLGGPAADWSATLKDEEDKEKAQAQQRTGEAPAMPASSLAKYLGSYVSEEYGQVDVTIEEGVLSLRRPTIAAFLVQEHGDHFKARWRSAGIRSVYGDTPVSFDVDADVRAKGLQLGPDRFQRK